MLGWKNEVHEPSCQILVGGSQRLLVSEGFYGIELCCFDGGQHAAHNAHETRIPVDQMSVAASIFR